MGDLQDLFTVEVMYDKMSAQLTYKDEKVHELKESSITKKEFINFLKDQNIVHGLLEEQIQNIEQPFSVDIFPMIIAQGTEEKDGRDGEIHYVFNSTEEVERQSDHWDFRDVMRLPTVKQAEKIAVLVPPTKGISGMTVDGKEIRAKDGKPIYMRAGKNVNFNESNQSYYAQADGLVNFGMKAINVYTIYEVNEDVSMRTGNVNFVGSVVIRGDVPSGFTIEAAGDIKIFGLVEAATIKAGGSIYISEGIAGLKTGSLEAEEDIHVGYMNQAIAEAGQNIHVEHSILHSECSAASDITCHRGNIIGGNLFAGNSVAAKNIGNRLNTPTKLSLGVDHRLYDRQVALEEENKQLLDNMKKMDVIKQKMKSPNQMKDSKSRIKLLKLQHSYEKMKEKLTEVETSLQKIELNQHTLNDTSLKIFGTIYPNTVISFGKYQRTIDKNYERVLIKIEQNDIIITENKM